MIKAAERLNKSVFQTHIPTPDAREKKLLVRRDRIQVKIHANFSMRGTVRPVCRASLTTTARGLWWLTWIFTGCHWKMTMMASYVRRRTASITETR